MSSIIDRTPPVVARLPLRCWQRLRLPGPVRRDALLQLAAVAHEKAVAADPAPDAPKAADLDLMLWDSTALTADRWRVLAAGVAVGDGLALLCTGRALLAERRFGYEPAVDPALTALRLALHHGDRDARRVAACELLLTLPQLLAQPVLSPVARGRVVVVEQVVYRSLLQASRREGSAADQVADILTSWVRVTTDALRRGYPVSSLDRSAIAGDHAALLAALRAGTGETDEHAQKAPPASSRSWPGTPGAGRGRLSETFPEDATAGPDSGDPNGPPSLTPFPTYDDAWTSDSRKALAARYAGLGAPMSLVLAPGLAEVNRRLELLAAEMPNFDDAITRVADHLRLARRLAPQPVLRLPPLLLLGPPGIGKSRFAKRLAELLGVPFAWAGLAGSSDNRTLAGTSRGWSSANPTWPVIQMSLLKVANPLLLLDEVDKAGGSYRNGKVDDTLLSLLEPGTARYFEDECLGGPVDLSAISWILTANDASGLPAPLRSRLAVVRCGPPLPHQVAGMIATMLDEIAREHGLMDARLLPPIEPLLIEQLRSDYAQHADPRRLRRGLVRVLGLAARLEEETGHAGAPTLH